MNTSDQIDQIAQALVAAYPGLEDVAKTVENKFGGYNYAPLDAVTALIRPVLSQNGIIPLQEVTSLADGRIGLSTRLLHSSGQWIASDPLPMTVESRKGMTAAQAVGSTITYARRYGLTAMLGIASEDDDDASDAGKPERFDTPMPKAAPKQNVTPINRGATPPAVSPDAVEDVWNSLEQAAREWGMPGLEGEWAALTPDMRKAIGASGLADLKKIASAPAPTGAPF